MRVILVSDSHGYYKAIAQVIDCVGDFDALVHLGDGFRDLNGISRKYPRKEFYAVCGNCDGLGAAAESLVIDLMTTRIFACHGHVYGVKSGLGQLTKAAEKAGAKIALYGHTHIAAVEKTGGVTLINPGSCAFPKEQRYPTYGILNIGENGFEVSIVEITPYGARPS